MWRLHLGLLGVMLVAGSTAGAEPVLTLEQRRAAACKILLEAQAVAHEITSPADRNSAMTTIGQVLINAGDETGALAIDKKIATSETPRPILKSLALAQLHAGRLEDALFTVRTMNDQEASDLTLISMARLADDVGDQELAVRLCKMVGGDARLDALLLATRIQHNAADLDGAGVSLDAAKLLARHQPEVAKVAETEALLGNLDRADKLMARLRREHDQSRVLAAIVSVEAAARDFTSADSHASDISVDPYRSSAVGAIALAHAEMGQPKDAVLQINTMSDDDLRLSFSRTLTGMELKSHGLDAGRIVAVAFRDGPAKAVSLSLVAEAAKKSGNADLARKTIFEAQAALFPEHDLPYDPALATVSQSFASIDMGTEGMTLAAKIHDSDLRIETVREVVRISTRLHDEIDARKLTESLKDARERAAGLTGIAEGILDKAGVERNPS